MNRQALGVVAIIVLGLACFVPASVIGGDDELQKKLELMRKQLDDLDKQQKALAKQRDDLQQAVSDLQREVNRKAEQQRKQKEIEQKKFDEADKKRHYVKIELRGKLIQSRSAQPPLQPDSWLVTTNETNWPLQFTDKKDLLQTAAKLTGKPVIVTGAISTQRRSAPYIFPTYPDDYLGSGPFWPQPGGQPRIRPVYPYLIQPEMQLPVIVESIRLFEEK